MLEKLISSYDIKSIKFLLINDEMNLGVATLNLEKAGAVLLLWKVDKWVEAVE